MSSPQECKDNERHKKEIPESPTPSCLSMKSDWSMPIPPNFSPEPLGGDKGHKKERPESSAPSCVSMKSDWSMPIPPNFSPEPLGGDRRHKKERPESSVPSCVSMKSDWSMPIPPNFSPEPRGGGESMLLTSRHEEGRTESPLNQVHQEEFCPVHPDYCYTGRRDVACDFCTGLKQRAVKSCLTCPASLCENHVKQHYTIPALQGHTLVELTGDLEKRFCQQHHRPLEVFCKTDQTHICKVCAAQEHKGHSKFYGKISNVPDTPSLLKLILGSMKTDIFNRYKEELRENYPECLGSQQEDLDITGVVKKMLESFGEQGALRLTLNYLDIAFPIIKISEVNKGNLMKKIQLVSEGLPEQGKQSFLNEIYTENYIIESGSGEVNDEHEVRQIERTTKRQETQENPIEYNNIFKTLPGQSKEIRTVLTKGIAGIGKTVSVQKFILDWAEGKANQDIMVIVPLPFRDLNLRTEKYSLIQLLHYYAPELKEIKNIEDERAKLLLIFDGLDECRFPLDFQNTEICCDVTKSTSVDVLLTNLIKGDLLPSALLWITSRPVAANQIPPECVHRVTEMRGFSDPQKEQYFRKRISDQNLADRIITHIKSSRSLHIMCHIPVFCWLSATVLENMMSYAGTAEIPRTLTEMYTHFLLTQISLKNKKYHGATVEDPKRLSKSDKEMILKLGKLAFQQLEKGNLIFYEEDLRDCGIDIHEASQYSSLCTEIFRKEFGLYRDKVFCFVHLSIQEHLAAVHAHVSLANKTSNVFSTEKHKVDLDRLKLFKLHQNAVDKALQSKNGHLDLFLRFLLGLSLEQNQNLLQDFMTETSPEMRSYRPAVTTDYIKRKIRKESSPERIINLFHCLKELKDNYLVEEIQSAFKSGTLSGKKLEPDQCSALAYMLLMSEEVLDEFDLKMYKASETGQQRLLPVLKICRRARLSKCFLSPYFHETVVSALQSPKSPLRELDLSYNDLRDSGVKLICAGLMSPNCKLQKLRLAGCVIGEEGCSSLVSALGSNPSHLIELDLSYNHLGDSGVRTVSKLLKKSCCKLEKLGLSVCSLTVGCSADLASVLQCPHSTLRELDLRDNDLRDLGVEVLCAGLRHPHCKLEKLGLSGCLITEKGCVSLASALRSNPSHLRELDLTYNHPGDSGAEQLSALLEDANCKLEWDHGGECRIKPGPRKYACQISLDQNTAHKQLCLYDGNRRVTRTLTEQPYPDHPERFKRHLQILCKEALSGRCYWEVKKSGDNVFIGVAYKSIDRETGSMGKDDKSFGLICQSDSFRFWQNGKRTAELHPSPASNRVGVFLDSSAGNLSFYSIFNDTLTLLYTFHTTFTEPLYAGFGLYPGSTVTLCHLG
ncbi:NLR family CARD domain-containing protein 3-like [Chanos chanos]|uniref:NLR family CARD domain-containing protein 3-like n=1 Tax=Chanos chanos TaxID=29144 RepID=A0A6J2URD7_CHACN|nr:NLR family CARD domain-containing protein 3-like [Chanos chanos]